MNKKLLLILAIIPAAFASIAQPVQPLKKTIEFQMPKTAEDEMPGKRGATVAWNPLQKKYYAAFAGNMEYPLGVFDEKGTLLSTEDQTTMIDVRGLWFDPSKKMITGNAYSEYGWFSYTLDSKGIPTEYEVTKEGMNQPNSQSVGAYNASAKRVLFLNNAYLYQYDDKAILIDSIAIQWGRKSADGPVSDDENIEAFENYNSSTVVYTGIKGQELGFLNIEERRIELYDLKTGFHTKTLTLPSTAIVEPLFNFALSNGTYWLFDMELRKWTGYK